MTVSTRGRRSGQKRLSNVDLAMGTQNSSDCQPVVQLGHRDALDGPVELAGHDASRVRLLLPSPGDKAVTLITRCDSHQHSVSYNQADSTFLHLSA